PGDRDQADQHGQGKGDRLRIGKEMRDDEGNDNRRAGTKRQTRLFRLPPGAVVLADTLSVQIERGPSPGRRRQSGLAMIMGCLAGIMSMAMIATARIVIVLGMRGGCGGQTVDERCDAI